MKELIEKNEEGASEQVVTAMRTILQGLFDAQIEKAKFSSPGEILPVISSVTYFLPGSPLLRPRCPEQGMTPTLLTWPQFVA